MMTFRYPRVKPVDTFSAQSDLLGATLRFRHSGTGTCGRKNHAATWPSVVDTKAYRCDDDVMTEERLGRVPSDTLPGRLVLIRRELGMSQRKAAEKAGMTQRTWQGMETGKATRHL